MARPLVEPGFALVWMPSDAGVASAVRAGSASALPLAETATVAGVASCLAAQRGQTGEEAPSSTGYCVPHAGQVVRRMRRLRAGQGSPESFYHLSLRLIQRRAQLLEEG